MKALLCVLLVAIFFAVTPARAEVVASAGMNLIFERDADGKSTDDRRPFAIRGGVRRGANDLLIEYSRYQVGEGEGVVSLTREHQEMLAWFKRQYLRNQAIAPYLGIGAGFYVERVRTSLLNESSTDSGDPEFILAAILGARWAVQKNFEISAEMRAAGASGLNPNPLLGIGLSLGVIF